MRKVILEIVDNKNISFDEKCKLIRLAFFEYCDSLNKQKIYSNLTIFLGIPLFLREEKYFNNKICGPGNWCCEYCNAVK